MARFILIGGEPYRGYTNTLTYTSLRVVGTTNNEKDMRKLVKEKYEECGGLLIVVDGDTGGEVVIP